MPKGPTADLPHVAFTHHRIGIHEEPPPSSENSVEEKILIPMGDVSHLQPIDQDRCLGLAYMELLESPSADQGKAAMHRGKTLLEGVVSRGLSDGEVEAGLATCYRKEKPYQAIQQARKALAHANLSPDTRIKMLWLAGSASFDLGQIDQAIQFLEPLSRIHRKAETYVLLDVCYQQKGRFEDSLKAARKAAEISPWRPDLQKRLAGLYASHGQMDLAREHSRRGDLLMKAQITLPP
jgi:tetratricopeptide (TPR) repeat protein